MAITYADYIGKGRIAAVLSAGLHEMLYDGVVLAGMMDFRPYTGGGSSTMNLTTFTRGQAMAAASSETSGGFTATDPTASQKQLAVALYGLQMRPTDLFKITGQNGAPWDVDYILGVLTESLGLTLTDLLTALFASVTGGVGTSGSNASTDDIYDAIYFLRLGNNMNPRRMAILHGQQINDIQESIRAEGGATQFRTDTQQAVAATGMREGDGYVFSFAGVDFHQCGSVGTANGGADRQGVMMAPGAFAYTLGGVGVLGQEMVDPNDILIGTDQMFVERDRNAANSYTDLYAKAYPGVVEMETARAVKITTDA